MARTTVEMKGLRELGQAMQGLSADVNNRIGRAAVAAGGRIIKKKAIGNAPQSKKEHQLGVRKSERVQPGNLKRNIIIKRNTKTTLTQRYDVRVRAGSGRAPKDAFYGGFVEFGTVKMGPKPYMAPAFNTEKQTAADAISAKLKQRIDKAKA